MRATDNQLIAANATGCLEVFSTPYPQTSWQIPWIHSLFGNTAAVATGVAAALRVKGRTQTRGGRRTGWRRRHHRHRLRLPVGHVRAQRRRAVHLLRQRGLHEHRCAALVGHAAGRAHRDQPGGRQRTRQRVRPGQERATDRDGARDPLCGHRVGSRCPDLETKVTKAMSMHGARYIHILVPCPLGWGAAPHDTVNLARLATESGLFPVFEAEHGEITDRRTIRRKVPVEDYPQATALSPTCCRNSDRRDRPTAGAMADRNIRRFGLLDKEEL